MYRTLVFCVITSFVLVGSEAYRVILGSNFHTVVPERCFRSAQPTASSLRCMVQAHGIRTVINLRGRNAHDAWYQDEERTTADLGVHFVNVMMSAHFKSDEKELRKLVDAIDHSPEPILLHCGQGSDRTGFAAACYVLLKTPATLAEAHGQLHLRFGHFTFGRTACQDKLLEQYGAWLKEQKLEHSPRNFRTWVGEVYVKDDWITP